MVTFLWPFKKKLYMIIFYIILIEDIFIKSIGEMYYNYLNLIKIIYSQVVYFIFFINLQSPLCIKTFFYFKVWLLCTIVLCLIISIDLVYYRVASLPEAIPTLDWTMYQSRVNVTGMVADFKKQYEGLTIPYPKDSYSSKIAEQEKTAVS